MLDYNTIVRLGAQSCARSDVSIEVALVTHGLNGRLATAMRVARKFPEFSAVKRLMEKTCSRRRPTDELNALLDVEYQATQSFVGPSKEILRDVDFLALLAGMAGFIERFETPERNSASIPLRLLEQSPDELKGRSPKAMVAMGMWFCDYNGYRDAVRRLVRKARKS